MGVRVRGNNSIKFKCKCGSDMFHQGKHHNVIMCAKCNVVFENQLETKLDYYGSVAKLEKGQSNE